VRRLPSLRSARRLVALALAVAVTAAAGLAAAAPGPGQESTPLERRVKAAFLYKFAGYVDWPASAFHAADEPLVIGVIGDDAMAQDLERLVRGRTSGGRPVLVRWIDDAAAPGNVHLLFIGRREHHRAAEVLRAVRQRPVLIVTESHDALDEGSMINFVIDEGRVRFEVNLEAVDRNGLGLSSRLLTVARNVSPKGS
jgi:hypothetical protein